MGLYGEIHRAKLLTAFENIPNKVWGEGGISIIDYGCGQGIAEMALADYINHIWIGIDFIRDITLIEPSTINLAHALDYTRSFYPSAFIKAIRKLDSQIDEDDIKPQKSTVIHIFSNVIDMDSFDGESIASILSHQVSHNNLSFSIKST